MLLPEKHIRLLLHKISNKNKHCSLQVQMLTSRAAEWVKASRSASCHGSFTVEAALVLPVVLFILCALLYFLIILNMQVMLYEELSEQARRAARYAYIYEELLDMAPKEEEELKQSLEPGLTDILYHGFSSAYGLEQIKKKVGREWLDRSCIRGGADGLSLLSDSLVSNNRMVDMVLRYRASIPFLPGQAFDLLCVQRVKIRTFTGFMPPGSGDGQGQESREELVYVTETGKVYHTNKYCSHLNLSVKAVDADNVQELRNGGGAKYYACELCGGAVGGDGKVYLTQHGNRYHGSAECSGLKRSWRAVPASEAGDRAQCARCRQQQ